MIINTLFIIDCLKIKRNKLKLKITDFISTLLSVSPHTSRDQLKSQNKIFGMVDCFWWNASFYYIDVFKTWLSFLQSIFLQLISIKLVFVCWQNLLRLVFVFLVLFDIKDHHITCAFDVNQDR